MLQDTCDIHMKSIHSGVRYKCDPDDCNNPNPRTTTNGHTKKNPLLMKTRRQDMHAAKAPANGHAKKNLWARTVGKKNLL